MIDRMPISMGTDGLRKKKAELEDRLRIIERGVSTFSKRVVYVKE